MNAKDVVDEILTQLHVMVCNNPLHEPMLTSIYIWSVGHNMSSVVSFAGNGYSKNNCIHNIHITGSSDTWPFYGRGRLIVNREFSLINADIGDNVGVGLAN